MMIREQIEAKLRAVFDPMYLEVVDEGHRHNIPTGSGDYSGMVLTSDHFTGERFFNRRRVIYGTLTKELSNTVYALVLHTYTIRKQEALQDTVFASPPYRSTGSATQRLYLQPLAFFQYVACRLSKDGPRATLLCLGNAQSERSCEQI